MRSAVIILCVVFILGCQTVAPQVETHSSVDHPEDERPGETEEIAEPPQNETSLPSETVDPGSAAEDGYVDDSAGADAIVAENADASSDAESGLSPIQVAVIAAAREVLETQSTVVGDTTYSYDCTGTILTVYARAGIFLADLFPSYSGNGVQRLHAIAVDYGLIQSYLLPEPGDLIFWDNTYDRNGDGEWNDELTHAGLVLSVAKDGTVEYLHHNYRRGIVTASMNLLDPDAYKVDGEEKNSPMRMASQRATRPDEWLSSHLFRDFASMQDIQTAALPGPKIASNW